MAPSELPELKYSSGASRCMSASVPTVPVASWSKQFTCACEAPSELPELRGSSGASRCVGASVPAVPVASWDIIPKPVLCIWSLCNLGIGIHQVHDQVQEIMKVQISFLPFSFFPELGHYTTLLLLNVCGKIIANMSACSMVTTKCRK